MAILDPQRYPLKLCLIKIYQFLYFLKLHILNCEFSIRYVLFRRQLPQGYFCKRRLPKGIFPIRGFPRGFFQVAASQGDFPKRRLPKGIFPSATSQGYFPKQQHPKGMFLSGNFPREFSQVATSQGDFSQVATSQLLNQQKIKIEKD